MSAGFSRARKVGSIAEEYEELSRRRCACGGRFRLQFQALLRDAQGTPYDRLSVCCESCGRSQEFLFDISAFFP